MGGAIYIDLRKKESKEKKGKERKGKKIFSWFSVPVSALNGDIGAGRGGGHILLCHKGYKFSCAKVGSCGESRAGMKRFGCKGGSHGKSRYIDAAVCPRFTRTMHENVRAIVAHAECTVYAAD